MKYGFAVCACVTALAVSACATNPRMSADFTAPEPPAQIVIFDPEVEYGLLTFGGLFEMRADWSETAEAYLIASIEDALEEIGHAPVLLSAEDNDALHQLTLLHTAVAASATTHGAGAMGPMVLPTKSEGWNWTLGPGAAQVAANHDGDLGLFVFSRGSFASGSRIATSILLGAAAGGAYVPTGAQRATIASLVDLDTGDIVWMGVAPMGDPRSEGGAQSIVSMLFSDAPLGQD